MKYKGLLLFLILSLTVFSAILLSKNGNTVRKRKSENKTEKEVLFFKRNNDLNISLDLELSSPKIILTDFFKEKIGEYAFQLCIYPPTWDKNDIEPLNETIITEVIIKDIVEAFNVHDIELKAFDSK